MACTVGASSSVGPRHQPSANSQSATPPPQEKARTTSGSWLRMARPHT